jgi:hypothetical protein
LERSLIRGLIEAKDDKLETATILLKTLRLMLNYAVFVGQLVRNARRTFCPDFAQAAEDFGHSSRLVQASRATSRTA